MPYWISPWSQLVLLDLRPTGLFGALSPSSGERKNDSIQDILVLGQQVQIPLRPVTEALAGLDLSHNTCSHSLLGD